MKNLIIRMGLCGLTAAIIVLLTRWQYQDFFFIDDAQNAFLPFFHEMGRIWLSGHVPILTTSTFWGGNILVDMQTSPFAPQTILASLFTTISDSFRLSANFFAWLNITLVIMGGYWLGRVLKIHPNHALLLGFLAATNHVFLYVFCASWWNYAAAFAWLVVSFAALLNFRQDQQIKTFVYAFLSLCCLFAAAGTQMQLAYAILFVIVLIFDYSENKQAIRLLSLSLVVICAVLITAFPLMAEYLFNKKLIGRLNEYSNYQNFLVPSWDYIINFFNPFYHSYINWFGGYMYMPLSLGYVGIIALLPIFFYQHSNSLSIEFKIILTATVVSLLLVFSSSQFGSTRWPFRYLPVSILLIAALVMYFIDRSELSYTPQRSRLFLGGMVFFALIQLFSAEGKLFSSHHLIFVAFFIVLCLLLIFPFDKQHPIKSYPFTMLCTVSVLAWLGIIAETPTLAETRINRTPLTPSISGIFPKEGYALSFPKDPLRVNKDVSDLFSGQFLLFGIKSINGYSAAGHRGIQSLLPSPTTHGMFKPAETLTNISQPAEGIAGVYDYQLMDIRFICLFREDLTPEIASSLAKAGLKSEPYFTDKLLFKPETLRLPTGSLTYQTVEKSISLNHTDGMLHEWFNVKPVDVKRTLIFSRVYWKGYHAVLNGVEYPVSAYKNALIKVELPTGTSGTLHLYYEPISWQYTKWSMILGLLLLGVAAKILKSPIIGHKTVVKHPTPFGI